MIIYKTQEEIELIRQSCLLVNNAIAEIAKFIKPGVSTMYLNNLAEKFIRDHGLFLLLKIIMVFLLHVAFQ